MTTLFPSSYGLGQVQQYLNLISLYESANQNVRNYQYDATHTAQGYYQITNTNWNNIAPLLGIDTSQYPSAMYAPQELQAQVATYLLTQTPNGISNWTNQNPQLIAALNSAGLQTSGTVTDGSSAPASSGSVSPIFDVSGTSAATPTADLLSTLTGGDLSFSQIGLDPTTGLILLGLGAVGLVIAIAS